jgi:Tfp pilus assembly protein PilF
MAAGNLDEARKHAIAAIQIDPKSIHAKELRGSIAMLEKDYDSAELIFESALKLYPSNFSLRNNLSLSLIEQKDEAKRRRALEHAEANVKQFPNSPEAASTYALVLYRLGRLDDAENAIHTAAAIASTDVDTAYVTARIAVDRGHKAEAKQLLDGALKSTGPAMFRQEAEELLEQLKK